MIYSNVNTSTTSALPNDVIENIIFRLLSLPALATCSRVCRVWNKMAMGHINAFSPTRAFGAKDWYAYFGGRVRNVPRLPSNITEILSSPCPSWPGKKVYETHLLVLVPQSVNGQPLTLKTLEDLVQNPLLGPATKYEYFKLGKYPDLPAPSHWVLLTRDVIEGSRGKSYQKQQALLERLSAEAQVAYEVPKILDAAVCILMEHVRSGTRLYRNEPVTYTRCQEKYASNWQLIVGGFGSAGLVVGDGGADYMHSGVGGSRKL